MLSTYKKLLLCKTQNFVNATVFNVYIAWGQYDQITKLFFQYSAIWKKLKMPNSIQIRQSRLTILLNKVHNYASFWLLQIHSGLDLPRLVQKNENFLPGDRLSQVAAELQHIVNQP